MTHFCLCLTGTQLEMGASCFFTKCKAHPHPPSSRLHDWRMIECTCDGLFHASYRAQSPHLQTQPQFILIIESWEASLFALADMGGLFHTYSCISFQCLWSSGMWRIWDWVLCQNSDYIWRVEETERPSVGWLRELYWLKLARTSLPVWHARSMEYEF